MQEVRPLVTLYLNEKENVNFSKATSCMCLNINITIRCILPSNIAVNGRPRPLEGDDVKNMRQELIHIRDRVNFLLDGLTPPSSVTSPSELSSTDGECQRDFCS